MGSSPAVRETDAETLRDMKIPVTLVVGGSEELLAAVGSAALSAQVLVAECGTGDATDTAAQMRPLVIVVPADIFDGDPDGYQTLARDVRAQVMRVPADFAPADFEEELKTLMLQAEAKRPSWSDDLRG
ncbi:MAG: hypothetical protein JRI68_22135 [Deltaproteobacteria bacterium]|nr:hypothetical protein [Deltaproteobacteria bacterium]